MVEKLVFANDLVTLYVADVMAALAEIEDESIDCCVTSPPYWGLRDYGVERQLGLERTLGEHLDAMVRVFAEVHRVLKVGGTCFVNYGDCYATQPNGKSAADVNANGDDDRTFRDKPFSTVGPIYGAAAGDPTKAANGTGRYGGGNAPAGPVYVNDYEGADRRSGGKQSSHDGQAGHHGRVVAGGYLKPTDLCQIPNRLGIALQDWGWYVRDEIVWGKSNPMPDSSGRYRPSSAHEKIFFLAKSGAPQWWSARDTGEVTDTPDFSERIITASGKDMPRWIAHRHFYDAGAGKVGRKGCEDRRAVCGWAADGEKTAIAHNRPDKQRGHSKPHSGFNERWDHMSKAEQSANGRYLRNYEPCFEPSELTVWEMATRPFSGAHFATFPPELVERALAVGCPEGGHVLDPFGGAGTTGLVAAAHGHRVTLIELNPDYAAIAQERIESALSSGLELQRRTDPGGTAGPLFDRVVS